ncbi:MAG: acyltransferase [Deltaproteobacteria bacterium CG11_big_fil_rev_8_21_14_0_20_45_16]|nr:MAG: acyltransferase [Deltaproteobacteria bacterium CG11_big_fil_rev_8_21_14_0_20_45_16]
MNRIRVGTLQYFIRPVKSFDEFRSQVVGLVETAADYKCRLLVFPEYFSVQLLTLGDVRRKIDLQIRELSDQVENLISLFADLSKKHQLYIVAGTFAQLSDDGHVRNRSYFFGPKGDHAYQGKLHMTRFEKEEWLVNSDQKLKIFETDFGKMAINICYDVEFPELARVAARLGAQILAVPSCTDERQGFLRVRYCAQARCIENQLFVMQSSTVGSLPNVPAVSLNYGQASILTPSDFPFARDGILAEGISNQESLIIGELDLTLIERARTSGTVLPLIDSSGTDEAVKTVETVVL